MEDQYKTQREKMDRDRQREIEFAKIAKKQTFSKNLFGLLHGTFKEDLQSIEKWQ